MKKETKKLTGIMMIAGIHYWLSGYFKAGLVLGILAALIVFVGEKKQNHLEHLLLTMVFYSGSLVMSVYFARELILSGFSIIMLINCWVSTVFYNSKREQLYFVNQGRTTVSIVFVLLMIAVFVCDPVFELIYPLMGLSKAGKILVALNVTLPILITIFVSRQPFGAKKLQLVKSHSLSKKNVLQ
ncbi:MAG: hypothetical protein IKV65_01370 [Erysipelotrichaceae bacterium]|nr:hypothetical protein [Erysipelotrichaceae bacterium]